MRGEFLKTKMTLKRRITDPDKPLEADRSIETVQEEKNKTGGIATRREETTGGHMIVTRGDSTAAHEKK